MSGSEEFESALRAWAQVFLRRSVHAFIVAMKDSGLSTSQLSTLMQLHYHGPCPVSAIGDDLGVTPAAASQIADRLAGLGLIERLEDPDDRRVRRLVLTARGRRLVARGVEARLAWASDLPGRLPPETLAPTVAALRRLTEAAASLEARPRPAPAPAPEEA